MIERNFAVIGQGQGGNLLVLRERADDMVINANGYAPFVIILCVFPVVNIESKVGYLAVVVDNDCMFGRENPDVLAVNEILVFRDDATEVNNILVISRSPVLQ